MANEEKRQHFEFIQNIITRLNSNSFMIKGWAITIISALLALAATLKNPVVLDITIVPVIAFWILDSIYLQHERKFRCFYNEAVKKETTINLYEIDLNKEFINNDSKNSFFKIFTSCSIISFYLSLLILTVVCIFLIRFNGCDKQTSTQLKICTKDTILFKEIDKKETMRDFNKKK